MANNSSKADEPLHIAVLPWLATGHLTPFLELSTRLALLGHRVSFLSTPSNLPTNKNKILPPLLDLVALTPSFSSLKVSSTADLTDTTEQQGGIDLRLAFDSLSEPLSSFLSSASPPVDWILCDYACHWTPRVARSHDVRSAFVSLFNATTCSYIGPPEALLRPKRLLPEDLASVPEWVPFPTSVSLRLHEARVIHGPFLLSADASGLTEANRFGKTIEECDLVAVRSCVELEGEWIGLVKELLYEKTVLPIGHFPPAPKEDDHDDNSKMWEPTFEWLDWQPARSVVYVAFGSEVKLRREQVHEIARGLDLSGLPFVWALKWPNGLDGVLPEGFEDRTAGRGLICRGWVPQVRFLGHPAVGGFVTHCGWNSVVEGLGFGLALVLVPMIFDQALNARLLEEKKVGKEVPRDEEDGGFDGDGIAGTLKLVMVDEDGEVYRARSRELRSVLGNKEVQDSYVTKFVDYLKDHRPTTPVEKA